MFYEKILEKSWLPDSVLRLGIRQQLKSFIHRLDQTSAQNLQPKKSSSLVPIAQAHLALPEFFCQVLGRQMNFSCGNWAVQNADLDEAEETMLRLIIQRAEISDGQEILELGCGWGALSLEMARQFPGSKITAVTDSVVQKSWIEQIANDEGLSHLRIVQAEIQSFETELFFDRIISLEGFNSVSDYENLFHKISHRLKPEAKIFAHFFCHREYSYTLDRQPTAENFLKGKMMPAEKLFRSLDKDLLVTKTWKVPGFYYHRTYEAWLKRLRARKPSILEVFTQTSEESQALQSWKGWRMFLLTWSELFRFNQGNEWYVSHTLFSKRG